MNDLELAKRSAASRRGVWVSVAFFTFAGGAANVLEPLIVSGHWPADGDGWKRALGGAAGVGLVALWNRYKPVPGAVTMTPIELETHVAEKIAASVRPPPLPQQADLTPPGTGA